jgi:hypothetical protein
MSHSDSRFSASEIVPFESYRTQQLRRDFARYYEHDKKTPEKTPVRNDVLKNHFLPVTYLRGFVGRDGKVNTWDLGKHFDIPKSPSDVCWERDLYTLLTEQGEDRRKLENVFARIENQFGRMRSETEKTGEISMNPIKRGMREFYFSWFVAYQFVRTKRAISIGQKMSGEKRTGHQARRNLAETTELAEAIFSLGWVFRYAPNGFVTADIPNVHTMVKGSDPSAHPLNWLNDLGFPITKNYFLYVNRIEEGWRNSSFEDVKHLRSVMFRDGHPERPELFIYSTDRKFRELF